MSIKRYLAGVTKTKVMFVAGLLAVFGLLAVTTPGAYRQRLAVTTTP